MEVIDETVGLPENDLETLGTRLERFYLAFVNNNATELLQAFVGLEVYCPNPDRGETWELQDEIVRDARKKSLHIMRTSFVETINQVITAARKRLAARTALEHDNAFSHSQRHIAVMLEVLGTWSNMLMYVRQLGVGKESIHLLLQPLYVRIVDLVADAFQTFRSDKDLDRLCQRSFDVQHETVNLHLLDNLLAQLATIKSLLHQHYCFLHDVFVPYFLIEHDDEASLDKLSLPQRLVFPDSAELGRWREIDVYYSSLEASYLLRSTIAACELPALLETDPNIWVWESLEGSGFLWTKIWDRTLQLGEPNVCFEVGQKFLDLVSPRHEHALLVQILESPKVWRFSMQRGCLDAASLETIVFQCTGKRAVIAEQSSQDNGNGKDRAAEAESAPASGSSLMEGGMAAGVTPAEEGLEVFWQSLASWTQTQPQTPKPSRVPSQTVTPSSAPRPSVDAQSQSQSLEALVLRALQVDDDEHGAETGNKGDHREDADSAYAYDPYVDLRDDLFQHSAAEALGSDHDLHNMHSREVSDHGGSTTLNRTSGANSPLPPASATATSTSASAYAIDTVLSRVSSAQSLLFSTPKPSRQMPVASEDKHSHSGGSTPSAAPPLPLPPTAGPPRPTPQTPAGPAPQMLLSPLFSATSAFVSTWLDPSTTSDSNNSDGGVGETPGATMGIAERDAHLLATPPHPPLSPPSTSSITASTSTSASLSSAQQSLDTLLQRHFLDSHAHLLAAPPADTSSTSSAEAEAAQRGSAARRCRQLQLGRLLGGVSLRLCEADLIVRLNSAHLLAHSMHLLAVRGRHLLNPQVLGQVFVRHRTHRHTYPDSQTADTQTIPDSALGGWLGEWARVLRHYREEVDAEVRALQCRQLYRLWPVYAVAVSCGYKTRARGSGEGLYGALLSLGLGDALGLGAGEERGGALRRWCEEHAALARDVALLLQSDCVLTGAELDQRRGQQVLVSFCAMYIRHHSAAPVSCLPMQDAGDETGTGVEDRRPRLCAALGRRYVLHFLRLLWRLLYTQWLSADGVRCNEWGAQCLSEEVRALRLWTERVLQHCAADEEQDEGWRRGCEEVRGGVERVRRGVQLIVLDQPGDVLRYVFPALTAEQEEDEEVRRRSGLLCESEVRTAMSRRVDFAPEIVQRVKLTFR